MTQRDAIPTIKQGNINQWGLGWAERSAQRENTRRMTNWRQQIIPVKKNTKEGKILPCNVRPLQGNPPITKRNPHQKTAHISVWRKY